jgi:hypothetical protein
VAGPLTARTFPGLGSNLYDLPVPAGLPPLPSGVPLFLGKLLS